MMTTLVVGASGATGTLLVTQLLEAGQKVKVMVRPESSVPDAWNTNENITIIKRNISEVSIEEMCSYTNDCQSVASCLGHNLSLKGIFGKPRNLVTHSVRLLCESITKNAPKEPVKFVLMNTAGNSNRDIHEPLSVGEQIAITLLRLFVPPHPDNEKAADYLRVTIGQAHPYIAWIVVRPDTLINEKDVSAYSLHPSPTRSAIFNAGKTSRINVANLMSKLTTDSILWNKWKGQMPVLYNDTASTA